MEALPRLSQISKTDTFLFPCMNQSKPHFVSSEDSFFAFTWLSRLQLTDILLQPSVMSRAFFLTLYCVCLTDRRCCVQAPEDPHAQWHLSWQPVYIAKTHTLNSLIVGWIRDFSFFFQTDRQPILFALSTTFLPQLFRAIFHTSFSSKLIPVTLLLVLVLVLTTSWFLSAALMLSRGFLYNHGGFSAPKPALWLCNRTFS